MPITEEQRLARVKCIGSSDAAAILGVDKHRNASDVWLEKTGRAAGFEGNADTQRGNFLEPALLAYAAHKLGKKIVPNVHVVSADHPELQANLDGAIYDGDAITRITEAKSTVVGEDWGDEGTDQVPERVLVQTHLQMYCAGKQCTINDVPVILPGYKEFDFRMYQVLRDQGLLEMMIDRLLDFWNRYVVKDQQPEDFRPSLEVVKRIRREPGLVTVLSPAQVAIVRDYEVSADRAKKEADEKELRKASLLAALGAAEFAEWTDETGPHKISYKEIHRKAYSVEATTFRQLRIDGKLR